MNQGNNLPPNPNQQIDYRGIPLKRIWLAGGCFWGTEAYLARLSGVAATAVGYANGHTANPTYRDVCTGYTGHAETVQVSYDPERIDLRTLLSHFFQIIDPTSINRQGNDRGEQYRSGIFYENPDDLPVIRQVIDEEKKKYKKPIVTAVEPLRKFYLAEDYHQKYLEKNPGGYCHVSFATLTKSETAAEIDASGGESPDSPAVILKPLIDPAHYQRPDDETLRHRLNPQQYQVTQKNATEQPFTGAYWDYDQPGVYVDIVTGEPLFTSRDKFDSGCGWPSFSHPIDPAVIKEKRDLSHGMDRVEVRSRVGDSHLGHIFTDGPQASGGLRYCINSAALRFIPLEKMEENGYGYLIPLIK